MNCGISDAHWADYLDRSLPAREHQRIESHLRVCASCRSEIDVLRQVDQRLRIECGLARQAMDLPEDARMAAQIRFLAALKEGAAVAGQKGIHERLWRVRWVLALLCGSNTATRIIQAAESHADSEQKWVPFLRRLTFLTTEVCGCSAGELIWAVGN
jgi:hypothetical protein